MSAADGLRGVLFDKDGTLFNDNGWGAIFVEAAEITAKGQSALVPDMLAAIGYDPATERFAAGSIGGAGNTFELADAWLAIAGGWEWQALVREMDALFTRLVPLRFPPVTDLPILFSSLKSRGLRLGIATNDVAASAQATIERFGLGDFIDFSAGYDSGHGAKPGPGMALAFCAATGLAPHQIAVVGDNSHDLEMGRSAGAGLNIGVLTGTSAHDDLAPFADHVIESIVALPALLDGLRG
ncbi:MAG: HAD family hydrolase [Parvibaculum sp.]|uniref:HAD family hydrolase n=1 Tax=Parvibaculum sp. TaxID=2024848 RepID=UPI002715D85D|nr:HAD family hydrolase [Parvibaculum sp.]MDO8839557.1 HAD family hydrolase [Parvibaculum sp.]